ncbi:MAG: DMT family transporter [Deltaproteobacteria bacterium]|nr:DMT family transporter [Deltaproteobacteria bacterium]
MIHRKILKNTEKLGAFEVLLGATMISFSGVYVKLAHVGPTVAGFYRVFFGGVLLCIIVFLKQDTLWKNFPTFSFGAFSGFIFALDLFVWHKSIHYIGPGLATVLANFQVFFLALIGILVLKEQIRLTLILAIPLAMVGLVMVVGIDWNGLEQNYKYGLFLGLATAVCYTAFVLALRKLQSSDIPLSPMANLFHVSVFSAIFLGAAASHQGESFSIPDIQSCLSLVAYGLFSQVFGWALISRGLPKIKASLTGLLLLLQPSLAFIWDIIFFKRETDLIGGIGAVLTLGAICLGTTNNSKKRIETD